MAIVLGKAKRFGLRSTGMGISPMNSTAPVKKDNKYLLKTFFTNDLQIKSQELFGVPGPIFMPYFKTYILKEEITDVDRYVASY